MNSNNKTISILSTQKMPESNSMFPSTEEIATKCYEVGYKKFKENFSAFAEMLSQTVNDLPEISGNYQVDSITFSLAVNGQGKISLIGEISAGVSSGLTLTIKKNG